MRLTPAALAGHPPSLSARTMSEKSSPSVRPIPMSPAVQAARLATLAQRLRQARTEAKILQEDAAYAIGSTVRSLTRWESGECEPGFTMLCSLAELYGVSLDWLADRSPMRGPLVEGSVLVDEDVLDAVRQLAERGGRLTEIPSQMIRHPGIDYAYVIPTRPRAVSMEEAARIDEEVRKHIELLKGKRS